MYGFYNIEESCNQVMKTDSGCGGGDNPHKLEKNKEKVDELCNSVNDLFGPRWGNRNKTLAFV